VVISGEADIRGQMSGRGQYPGHEAGTHGVCLSCDNSRWFVLLMSSMGSLSSKQAR